MRYAFIATYIMASRRNGTLYVGVTSDLLQRGLEHREGRFDGFAKRYGCTLLVWWEQHGDMPNAIAREKQLKRFGRAKKLTLIEAANPQWRVCTRTCCCRSICAATMILGTKNGDRRRYIRTHYRQEIALIQYASRRRQ